MENEPEDREFIDRSDMYNVLSEFPTQCEEASRLGKEITVPGKITKIVIAGMGGSSLVGGILKSLLNNFKIPIFVVKDYFLPEFINKKTLIFVISYSGNTEETINMYRIAVRKAAKIVVIASGGVLKDAAIKHHVNFIEIPSGHQPRLTVGYQFFPILNVLSNIGLIPDLKMDMKKTIEALRKPIFKDKARDLAKRLVGKTPIIYSSKRLESIAYKWKINFSENSKVLAFSNTFPELNHNEMQGFVNAKNDFYVIIIKDDDDYHRIKKRMLLTKEVIKRKEIPVTEIALTGYTFLTKLFSAIYIGDWTSYFLAIDNNVDPTPVELIEDLKRKL